MKTALLAAVILMAVLCSGATAQAFDPAEALVFDKGPPANWYGLSWLGDEIYGSSWGFSLVENETFNFDWVQAQIASVPTTSMTWKAGSGLREFSDASWALAYESGDGKVVAAKGPQLKQLDFGMLFTDPPASTYLLQYQAYSGGVLKSNYNLWISPHGGPLGGLCVNVDPGTWDRMAPVPEPWAIVSACALVAPAGLLFRRRRRE